MNMLSKLFGVADDQGEEQLKELVSDAQKQELEKQHTTAHDEKPQEDDAMEQKVDEAVDTILYNTFVRINHVFTEKDKKTFEELLNDEAKGDAVRYFVLARVPHFDALLQEEIEKYKKTLSEQP